MISGVRLALLQRPDVLMLGVAMATGNAYLTEERLVRWRKGLLVVGTVGLVVWFAMLNLSSGLVRKLGGPYFDYLPSGPAEFTRPQMLDIDVLVPVRSHHRCVVLRRDPDLPRALQRVVAEQVVVLGAVPLVKA